MNAAVTAGENTSRNNFLFELFLNGPNREDQRLVLINATQTIRIILVSQITWRAVV